MNSEQSGNPSADLEQRIDAIESGYEFLLAYAAQGRDSDRGAGEGRNVREFLGKMAAALDGLAPVVVACADRHDSSLADGSRAFFDALAEDARRAEALIKLVLSQTDIGSQLVDNLNASIHLRALLTDLFVIDEAFKRPRTK
jgi:hypothetical protein